MCSVSVEITNRINIADIVYRSGGRGDSCSSASKRSDRKPRNGKYELFKHGKLKTKYPNYRSYGIHKNSHDNNKASYDNHRCIEDSTMKIYVIFVINLALLLDFVLLFIVMLVGK